MTFISSYGSKSIYIVEPTDNAKVQFWIIQDVFDEKCCISAYRMAAIFNYGVKMRS